MNWGWEGGNYELGVGRGEIMNGGEKGEKSMRVGIMNGGREGEKSMNGAEGGREAAQDSPPGEQMKQRALLRRDPGHARPPSRPPSFPALRCAANCQTPE